MGRLKLQNYLYNKDIESMYASLIFPTRMYTSEYGNVMIKNFEELRKFVQSKFFISYWLSEFELPSVATLFNVDLTIHYISKGRGDNFGNSVNVYESKGLTNGRKIANVLYYEGHYSSICRKGEEIIENKTISAASIKLANNSLVTASLMDFPSLPNKKASVFSFSPLSDLVLKPPLYLRPFLPIQSAH